MIAHLQNGRYGDARILEESTAVRMQSRLFGSDPRLPGMAHGFKEGRLNGHRSIGHRGDTYIFHSELQLIPDLGVGIFVSYNSGAGRPVRKELIGGFMDRYFLVEKPAPLEPPADFADHAGRKMFYRRSPFAGVMSRMACVASSSNSATAKYVHRPSRIRSCSSVASAKQPISSRRRCTPSRIARGAA